MTQWMEGWAYWYSMADIALPVRAHLTSLIFSKSLRRKDIRTPETGDSEGDGHKGRQEPDNAETESGSGQFVANLVGVDTERIERFSQYSFLVLLGVFKLVFFSAFLVRLIGWLPFGAGLVAWAVTLPANAWLTTLLFGQAGNLMRQRDEKLARVAEALRGIKQIRFAALEARWERTIQAARERELNALWRFFLLDTGLFACWIVSPILLAATSLSVYVVIHGRLLPSVAFVSIGMFSTLETTLGSLPELVTLGLESAVSIRRIGRYLQEPEVVPNTTSSSCPQVEFHKVSVTWPSDDLGDKDKDRFVLEDLDLSFPRGELSVISGKTGTGKTLLVSAILGEADVLKGSIIVPSIVSDPEDYSGGGGDVWTTPGSVAYVSQNPWLVNTTLRDNILFGLPLAQPRYSEVLQACALEHDLVGLPDGDETEIGTHGANLSGGQQWRVTLARAVYSKAEILVLEDIFSAVDTHVGRHIFQHCLTGDICRDRTRILVTHNLGLVLPSTSYMVELGSNGKQTKAYSISPRDLLSRRSSDDGDSGDVQSPHTTVPSAAQGHPPPSALPTAKRRLMQEEGRERGSVKAQVYLRYIKSCGGVSLWTAAALVFLAYEVGIIGTFRHTYTWPGNHADLLRALLVATHLDGLVGRRQRSRS